MRLAQTIVTVVLIALISGTASAQMPDSNDAQQVSDLPTGVQDPVIDEVRFSGLVRIDLATATARVGSKSGAKLDRDQVSKDIKRLFATSAFEDVQAWLVRETTSRGDQVLVLVYRVVERPAIESIKVEGAKEVKEEDVRKKIMVRTASILDVNRIRQSVDAIREHYVEQGFFLAEVDYKLVTRPENMVDVVFTIREHAKVKIQRVEFVGNNNIPSKELKKIIGTQEGSLLSFLTGRGTFAQEMFEQDLQRLEFYYNTKGFAEVRFDQPIVSLSRDRKFIQIVITVHEGPQYKVGEVSVEGDLLFAKEELMKGLALKSGEIFNAMNVQKDAMALSDKYKDLGYAFATVGNATNFRRDELLLDFTYVLQKGEKARFGRIEIIGNEGTRDWTIRREMRIYEGDLYNETKLRASEARIRRLGFFEKVEIRPKATSRPDEVDVIVEVKERQTGAFSVGAGFSSVENFLFQAQINKQNFLGRGQNIRLEATLSSLRRYFVLSFDEPYLFDTNWTFGFSAFNADLAYYNFSQASTGLDLTFGRRFLDDFSVSATYRLETVKVRAGGQEGVADVPIANLDLDGLTSSLSTAFMYDSRDDRMFPTRGNVTSLSLEWAGSQIGSDFDFIRMQVRSRQYFPLIWGAVAKIAGSWGYILSPTGKPVPIFERFQVGGIFTVRGFERASLGPSIPVGSARDPNANPTSFKIGGAQQLIFNFEIEFPIFQQIGVRGVVFFDAGNAYDDGEWPNPLKMRTSAGLGIRWFSPIGPLRFEWGFPLKRLKGEPPVVFEFNIGTF
ncbi:MAG: Outer membrane protein assembly factor BamA precursor [Deltaproteobacteria bacterium ADurb.Bin058]|nr:MAG: Outer membrane protein assembly factor BamA precursor [Deltaproteobacteria bacterium ADurb.Bin058]